MFSLLAQINNPVLPSGFGGPGSETDGSVLGTWIILLWRTLIMLGALATIIFLIWGALDWIMAGGDEGKVSSARKKMTGAVVGLAILASSVAIVSFVGALLGFDLLEITFPSPDGITAPASGGAVPGGAPGAAPGGSVPGRF